MTPITPALATVSCTRTGSACTRRTYPPRTADHKGQPRGGDPTNSPGREPRDTDPHEIPSSAVSAAQSAPRPRGQQPGGPPLHKAPQRLLWRAAKEATHGRRGPAPRPAPALTVHCSRFTVTAQQHKPSHAWGNNELDLGLARQPTQFVGGRNKPNLPVQQRSKHARGNNEPNSSRAQRSQSPGEKTNPIRRLGRATNHGSRITNHESRDQAQPPATMQGCRGMPGPQPKGNLLSL